MGLEDISLWKVTQLGAVVSFIDLALEYKTGNSLHNMIGIKPNDYAEYMTMICEGLFSGAVGWFLMRDYLK